MATAPDGRSYIGVTRHSHDLRWQQHCSVARRSRWRGHIARAIRAFGPEAFCRRVLVVANDMLYLKEMEVRAIAAFGTLYPDGLNGTEGGDGMMADQITELKRRKQLHKTKSTKAYRQKNVEIQREYWTPERREERARLIQEKWADPSYRDRILAARKKPVQTTMLLRPVYGAAVKRHWQNPEYRERITRARAEAVTPEYRAKVAENQRRVMEDPAARLRIAVSLNRFRECTFRKAAEPRLAKYDRGGLLQNTIPSLPDTFDCADAVRLGWMGREFTRALDRGWIVKVSGDVR